MTTYKQRQRAIIFIVCMLSLAACINDAPPAVGLDMASSQQLEVQINDATYSGSPLYPNIIVKHAGKTLRKGTDYSVAYRSNVNAGQGKAIVTGKKSYAGKRATATFSIAKAPISHATSTGLAKTYDWSGKQVKPSIVLRFGKKALKKDRDYTLSYGSNINPGKATITITGMRNFSGACTLTFAITKASLAKASIDKISSLYTTSLSDVKPKPKVKLAGKTLKEGTDYTVSYKNNRKPGTASLTVKGKGKYTGHKTVKFKLVNMGDDLARAACKLSYSRGVHYQGGKYPGTRKYRSVYTSLGCPNKNTHGRGCDAGMCTVMRWSGFDKSFPSGCGSDRSGINKYLGYASGKGTSSKWQYVGKYVKGKTKLLPGDVLFGKMSNGYSHVCMYVGKPIAKEIYKKNLKGTDADVGNATGTYVSSHFSNPAALGIGGGQWSLADASFYKGKYKVYRCVKPSNKHYRAGKAVKRNTLKE